MATGDYQFNFTNLNPLNTSGWSTSTLAAKLKAAQDATAAKEAADAAQASVYGHMNAGKGDKKSSGLDAVSGIAGLALGGPVGGVLGAAGGGLFGGSDPRTPAEKLAHQTKMLAKQETKTTKTATDLANAQQNITALNEAIAKATDPAVIENLNKELEKEQKALGKVQKKHDANTSHVDEVKKKITGLDPNFGKTTAPTQANYYNDLVDKELASRTGVSGWHPATTGTPLVNPEAGTPVYDPTKPTTFDPITGNPINQNPQAPVSPRVSANLSFSENTTPDQRAAATARVNQGLQQGFPTSHVKKYLKQQKKFASGWSSVPAVM